MQFKVNVYNVIVHVHLYENEHLLDKALKRYTKKFNFRNVDGGLADGLVFLDPTDCSQAYALFSKRNLSHGLIAHEATHLAFNLFFSNNIQFGHGIDDENFALLNGYIVENIYKILEKKCVKVK